MIESLLENIKYFKEEHRLKVFVICIIVFFITKIVVKRKKNSGNFKDTIIEKNTDIYIGDKKKDNSKETWETLNSDNFKNTKIKRNSKIHIGDRDV